MPEGYPQEASFPVGDVPARSLITIIKVLRPRALVQGTLKNTGDLALTFSVQGSSDNGVSDAYTSVNVRNNGASVSPIVIQPGGEALFFIEAPAEQYIQFNATPQPGAVGLLRLFSPYGHYVVKTDIGIP